MELHKLKLVKNAKLKVEDGLIKIVHYGTPIFEFNNETKSARILLDCSQTSNRQINEALSFFAVDKNQIMTFYNKPKWSFSRSIMELDKNENMHKM